MTKCTLTHPFLCTFALTQPYVPHMNHTEHTLTQVSFYHWPDRTVHYVSPVLLCTYAIIVFVSFVIPCAEFGILLFSCYLYPVY